MIILYTCIQQHYKYHHHVAVHYTDYIIIIFDVPMGADSIGPLGPPGPPIGGGGRGGSWPWLVEVHGQ